MRTALGLGALFSTLLLVYASIVPLRYQPLTWDASVEQWRNIPWLRLGVFNRADWIANALIVMPSAFLTAGFVDNRSSSRRKVLLLAPLIILLLAGVVLGIEMVQVWFPPRTVSQNDIVAGWIGAILGVLAWLLLGRQMICCLEAFCHLERIQDRLRWLSVAAIGICIAYTLYPLDFVLSREELQNKMATGRIQWSLSLWELGSVDGLKGIVLSILRMIPFGLWLALRGRRQIPFLAIFLVAVAFEAVQIPIFSKYATSWEAIGGIAGGVIGFLLVCWFPLWGFMLRRRGLWVAAYVFWIVVIVIAFDGRYSEIVRSEELLAQRWNEFFTPPLLRYYYTSEYSALSNLAGKLGMFGVLGFLFAGAGWAKYARTTVPRYWLGAAFVVFLSLAIELSQIYLFPLIADASDVAIYFTGYSLGYLSAYLILVAHHRSSCDLAESNG